MKHFFVKRLWLASGCIAISLFLLSACGVKGKLVRPSDIPAYEKHKEQHGSFPL